MKRILLALAALVLALPAFSISSKAVFQAFQNPQDAYRPYVRWWWNGDCVTEPEIRREMNLLKEAGIAGVEINPISFPGRPDDALGKKSLVWLSDEWIDMLGVAFDEAKKLGVKVSESDLAQELKELPLPDGKSSLKDYLRTLGGSLQDYLGLVKQQVRSSLTLDRIRETMAKEYCAEHGIDFDIDHLPEEVSRAVNEKIDGLIESHRDEIKYYF